MKRFVTAIALCAMLTVSLSMAWSQGSVELNITSDVSGAAVFIDGVFVGAANPVYAIRLPPGDKDLVLRAMGFPDYHVGLKLYDSPVNLSVFFKGGQQAATGQGSSAPPPTTTNTTTTTTTTTLPPAPPVASLDFPEMVYIPAGATTDGGEKLTIPYPMEVSKYEVTNRQFVEFLNDAKVAPNGMSSKGYPLYRIEDRWAQIGHADGKFYLKPWKDPKGASIDTSEQPVNFVTWYGAVEYCNWLSRKAGVKEAYVDTGWFKPDLGGREQQGFVAIDKIDGFRLPAANWVMVGSQTSPQQAVDEWTFASRGGASGRPTKFSGSDNPDEVAWLTTNVAGVAGNSNIYGNTGTMKVGLKKPNELGLYDMTGNLSEWSQDGTLRGGGFIHNTDPATYGFSSSLQNTGIQFGFRVFRTALRPTKLPTSAAMPTSSAPPAPEPAAPATAPKAAQLVNLSLGHTLRASVYGGGRFIIGGNGAMSYISTDGVSWAKGTKAPLVNISGLAYGNGLYVAVGDNGGIATTADGKTWAMQRSNAGSHFDAVVWTGKMFVAVGHYGLIRTSIDGKTWNSAYSGATAHLMAVAASDSKIVALGIDGSVVYSSDGASWKRIHLAVGSVKMYALAYGPSGFIATGAGDTASVFLSTDGASWSIVQKIEGNKGFTNALWTGTRYLLSGTGTLMESSDGRSWKSVDVPSDKQLHALATGKGSTVINLYDGSGVLVLDETGASSAPVLTSAAPQAAAAGGAAIKVDRPYDGGRWWFYQPNDKSTDTWQLSLLPGGAVHMIEEGYFVPNAIGSWKWDGDKLFITVNISGNNESTNVYVGVKDGLLKKIDGGSMWPYLVYLSKGKHPYTYVFAP